jgi:hypothetical protein
MPKQVDLMQGTLEMLILRPYRWVSCMATASCCAFSRLAESS